ncbi:MAG: Peptidyl-tRNA hydrolase [Candidatus Falkowbacteria bacterium GW2011_GWC2_38_22]|uniref:Peptidyl-tRNA hydrolase n=1 Tax=Candidatus Falkowbacteria bacterium GW2011_GWE1_38_31 TaxID=1618638 RepID=A0A0G0N287_9BACT|nr:MAG: Peptidyl-tRNA hydrolase [Candidatus Falkowbacteria bacterium GW2011_GWF2_38_1205]KKQ61807.1 MAG: Peptidyl-tRNA hydrolase [Candidatus Falkowbacteria bacterium GW2011_GWC2_38_22]KKQ64115.1 MAG: Peptidyl-tRNA hydrolase [Candidatus Falkowbacteria bacterium GW2011_GWF1_38_22]KKQ66535.1 MAG: Peptidyl-tRNA hydrolase [Candidatus Falkowbacteria bacterium GW2011_GWE2_38_254]KKQ71221.1 MAG: Peptidyl-tRNA hydrolase [Candidatus Falkowbacteria bacterium GW2011_GWE1_38_31]KKQ73349.1 MAG: Peptidyl-tRN
MKIIAGLGNPGEKYKYTRHNAGFMALDHHVKKQGLDWEYNKKFEADIAKQGDVIYIKPKTFMNESGKSLNALMSYYKLLPKKLGFIKEKDLDLSDTLIVIHDDLDIELGKCKESIDSRSAGHNGVNSIINHLKTKNFKRLRIGIMGDKPKQMPTINYVLQKFRDEELLIINSVISEIKI